MSDRAWRILWITVVVIVAVLGLWWAAREEPVPLCDQSPSGLCDEP